MAAAAGAWDLASRLRPRRDAAQLPTYSGGAALRPALGAGEPVPMAGGGGAASGPVNRLQGCGRGESLRASRRASSAGGEGDSRAGAGEAAAVTMGMGEAARGALPAAGWEWFFPRPAHCGAI